MAEALVTPKILRWARERAGLSVEGLAEKLKVDTTRIVAWEKGEDRPTFRQAEKFAVVAHIPFGYLFLRAPPEEKLPIPDLRSMAGRPEQPFSAGFLDLLRDVLYQQGWFREYLIEQGARPLPFVGHFAAGTPLKKVAKDIRAVLDLDGEETDKADWKQRLTFLSDQCEKAGIWVMRTGIVGNNTHRTLDVSDFRGFSIVDTVAPLIVINTRDAEAAQAFTLMHEVAHIWLGQSGISDPNLGRKGQEDSKIERQCDRIAAEVLVPEHMFLECWSDDKDVAANSILLSKRFRVSKIVIARRALEFKKISWDTYWEYYNNERLLWTKKPSRDGNFYNTTPARFGKRFLGAVLSRAMSGDLLLRDAAELLHVKPATVRKCYNNLG
ncbi:MAG: ImmA/IrrE family metallo-endopeptidase [Alphaproteobacteria bacterium]